MNEHDQQDGNGVQSSKILADGNVLVEFFGSDAKTCNTQVVAASFAYLPILAYVTQVGIGQSAEAAREKWMEELMRRA